MNHVVLILGRHGADDHYLGGRFRRAGGTARKSLTIPFRMGRDTVHLFELIEPGRLRQAVPAQRIFPDFTTRYQLSALRFAKTVEERGGRNFNAEARADEALDREYSRLYDATIRSDLAFFKEPTYARFLDLSRDEVAFGRFREDLMISNIEHFTSRGHDVIARLGRVHSRVRRLDGQGLEVTTHIGSGNFFPTQVLYRKTVMGIPATAEDRQRGYVDQVVRTVPTWSPGSTLPHKEIVFSLQGDALREVVERFETLVTRQGSLPKGKELLGILNEASATASPPALTHGSSRSRVRALASLRRS